MANNIEILLMVIAVNACVLGLGGTALYFLNRAVDPFDRTPQWPRLSGPATSVTATERSAGRRLNGDRLS
jgi:hypothetical protein